MCVCVCVCACVCVCVCMCVCVCVWGGGSVCAHLILVNVEYQCVNTCNFVM